ncbi:GNAT family N-acetyltransferase [Streptomyces sp. H27-D2]|uniref:GNAT family N-acetyltransferase n=1 Tax=Streptomyces sp. H27-D2 TaxID=3046304 RepID=UPI002DB8CF2E|nr:GNAT family N-acetyltransferase [Streptomyces sp. H27-D2]MEC4018600.1 GNAT family N-acetyltransferase [Streptomyces sp. H27-D2]
MDDLLTERLALHPLSLAEAERVLTGEPDDGARWASGYPDDGDRAGARRFLDTCADTGDPQPFGAYEIRRREGGHAIGGLGFHGPADETGSVTIGYGLILPARGKGYAGEALRALLLFAHSRGITRVKGDTAHDNIASQRVMSSVGMRLVAEDGQLKHFETAWSDATAATGHRP